MTAHVHHWLLEPAGNGPISAGTCRLCGLNRLFCNVYDADRPESAALRQALPGTKGNGVVKKRPPQIGRRPENFRVYPTKGGLFE